MLCDPTSASWLEIGDIHLSEPSSKKPFEAQAEAAAPHHLGFGHLGEQLDARDVEAAAASIQSAFDL